MPGVHQLQRPRAEVDPAHQSGHEVLQGARRRVLEQGQVRRDRLLEQRGTPVAGAPQAGDAQRGGQRGRHAVPHRVRQGQVQVVAGQAEVEGVAGDVRGRLQPGGQGERPGLAGLRPGQQPVLDLGGQAQRSGALSPLVEVGVAPVRDHHEGQQVRQPGDLVERRAGRLLGQAQLQQPDHLAPLGHRRQHQPGRGRLGRPRRGRADHLDLLRPHRLLGRAPVERQHRRGLLSPRVVRPARAARRAAAPSSPSRCTCASRTSARPERSATRKPTWRAPRAWPSSRVTASDRVDR